MDRQFCGEVYACLLACIHCTMGVYHNYQLVQMARMGMQFRGGEPRFWQQAVRLDRNYFRDCGVSPAEPESECFFWAETSLAQIIRRFRHYLGKAKIRVVKTPLEATLWHLVVERSGVLRRKRTD